MVLQPVVDLLGVLLYARVRGEVDALPLHARDPLLAGGGAVGGVDPARALEQRLDVGPGRAGGERRVRTCSGCGGGAGLGCEGAGLGCFGHLGGVGRRSS